MKLDIIEPFSSSVLARTLLSIVTQMTMLRKVGTRSSATFITSYGPPVHIVRGKVTCCANKASSSGQTSRRLALQFLTMLPLTAMQSSEVLFSALAAEDPSEKLQKLTAPIVMCRRVMGPVDRYIDEGSWDKGRTNVNYCTRVLAMRKNMLDAADLLEGDAYYDALDVMGEMINVMSQLDASLYTPLFIPTDEGTISVEQEKYQEQARDFYNQAIDGLDKFLSIIPSAVLDKAIALADKTKYEITIERD